MYRSIAGVIAGATLYFTAFFVLPLHAQTFTEVNVSKTPFGDIEFDSARDGTYCATCNFGHGNSRFNWGDKQGNLWVGHVDWNTGAFVPQNGKSELVDSSAAYWKDFGNGPEWAFSQQGSQLIYTRYAPGMPHTTANAGIGLATQNKTTWTAAFIPGGLSSVLPESSQWLPDPVALTVYFDPTAKLLY